MSKIAGFLRLIRPINCILMGFAVITGAVLAGVSNLITSWVNLFYGFVTGFTLTAASMAINDYHDQEIDAVNEPERPLPSGIVKPLEALVFASTLSLIGFLAAYLVQPVSMFCLYLAVVAWLIFVAYTIVGKRSGLPGNFLVSACVAIPFIYGSIVALDTIRLNVLVFASIAFLSNTAREITKGIVDVQGDKMKQVHTLAVSYGEKVAAIAAVFFYVLAVALSPIPWLMNTVTHWFIPLAIVTDGGLLFSAFMLLRDRSRENVRKVKQTVLLWFVTGLLAFVAGAYG